MTTLGQNIHTIISHMRIFISIATSQLQPYAIMDLDLN
jgi:hypothetical protein